MNLHFGSDILSVPDIMILQPWFTSHGIG